MHRLRFIVRLCVVISIAVVLSAIVFITSIFWFAPPPYIDQETVTIQIAEPAKESMPEEFFLDLARRALTEVGYDVGEWDFIEDHAISEDKYIRRNIYKTNRVMFDARNRSDGRFRHITVDLIGDEAHIAITAPK